MNDFETNRKWAIISQITSFGWLIALFANLKKKRNSFFCCYMNNGLFIFIYGCILVLINEFYRKGNYSVPGGAGAVELSYLIQDVFTFILLILNLFYFALILGGLYFSIKGEERRIPYLFRIKLFDNLNVFKPTVGGESNNEFSSNYKTSDSREKNDKKPQKTIYDSIHHIGKAASDLTSEISIPIKKTLRCPACGKEIMEGDPFCTFCGVKIDINKSEKIKSNGGTQHEEGRITVVDYIKRIKNYTCDNCGEKVTGEDKYCPNCGKTVVFKIKPISCDGCGFKITDDDDFAFCPKCGKKIELVVLHTTCKMCGADLLFGKDFCIKCGTKVNDTKESE